MILADTDIFIEAMKNSPRAIDSLRHIGFENIAVSAITLMELYFGAMNKRELAKIKSRLIQLRIVQLDQDISKTATDLVEKYAKSHGLRIPDALIAATAICQHMELLTYNEKDFRFIDGLILCLLNENNDFLSASSPGDT
jgi:predicted nucleic acid-binding protein